MDKDLADHRKLLLNSALPYLEDPQDPGLNSAIIQMANAVASQAAEAQTSRLAREIERDQPTLPSSKFSALFPVLKNLLNVRDEGDLPEFWFALAAATKKQEFSVVRESLDAFSRTPQAFINSAPIPTPKMVSDLTTITFVGDHPDDLKSGINPFVVMDGSEEFRLAAQDIARNYTTLSERDFGLSYNDLNHFNLPKELRAHPVSFFELEKSLGLFGNFLFVILGANHPLSGQYHLFWTAFTRQFRNQLHYEIDTRRIIKPVHILRNIQLICYHWFQSQRSHVPPSTPQFLDILTRISLSTYYNPNLPQSLYQLVSPKPLSRILTDLTKSGGDDSSTVTTGMSTLTPGSEKPGPSLSGLKTTGSRSGTFVRNSAVDPALRGLLPPGIKILDIVGSDAVALADDNSPICLSFHIRGGCFTNCRRKDNHSRDLSAAEKQRVSNWMVDQTAKLRAKLGSG